jgi:hypothetical protein
MDIVRPPGADLLSRFEVSGAREHWVPNYSRSFCASLLFRPGEVAIRVPSPLGVISR